MKILVTGGSGFIGSAFIRNNIKNRNTILNIDKLKYFTAKNNLADIERFQTYQLEEVDIRDRKEIKKIFNYFNPEVVVHFAAESHVDHSIKNPNIFIETNINGTFNLLVEGYDYWLSKGKFKNFKFLHISTDEVYGALEKSGLFHEKSPYNPRSPYSASKASSDHLVKAWNITYEFPAIITNCSNNYGPNQFHDKFIPMIILNALNENKIPIYGNGKNIRDWLFVEDHINALNLILKNSKTGTRYNIGGESEIQNIKLVDMICSKLDKKVPNTFAYKKLVEHVDDRPGHDFRYAINNDLMKKKFNWRPTIDISSGLDKTIDWYIEKKDWFAKFQ